MLACLAEARHGRGHIVNASRDDGGGLSETVIEVEVLKGGL